MVTPVPITPVLGVWKQQKSKKLLALAAAGLVEMTHSRFTERLCLKKTKWRETGKLPVVYLWPLHT